MIITRATLTQSLLVGVTLATMSAPTAHAKMTPQECYKRDSNCTQFCGNVQDADWRHECFMRCNIYLDNCLSKGEWTDQALQRDPGTNSSPTGGTKINPGILGSGGLLEASPGLGQQGPAAGGGATGGAPAPVIQLK